MNKTRLLQLAQHLRTIDPDTFDMRFWIAGQDTEAVIGLPVITPSSFEPECGTAGCIAGHACALFAERPVADIEVGDTASALLGLDTQQALDLFHAKWLDDGTSTFRMRDVTTTQAADRLEYLAAQP